jgi:hypothetical protein
MTIIAISAAMMGMPIQALSPERNTEEFVSLHTGTS